MHAVFFQLCLSENDEIIIMSLFTCMYCIVWCCAVPKILHYFMGIFLLLLQVSDAEYKRIGSFPSVTVIVCCTLLSFVILLVIAALVWKYVRMK